MYNLANLIKQLQKPKECSVKLKEIRLSVKGRHMNGTNISKAEEIQHMMPRGQAIKIRETIKDIIQENHCLYGKQQKRLE
jgi:hypothetical protein